MNESIRIELFVSQLANITLISSLILYNESYENLNRAHYSTWWSFAPIIYYVGFEFVWRNTDTDDVYNTK